MFRPNKCQHNFVRQFIVMMYSEMLNSPHSKPMTDYRIPLGQQKDLRHIIFEIVTEFAPFAAAVREIFVDCGGYFSAPFFL